ncbi:hypothetical protein MJO28_011168 [Puccinia striiformis f. sp. tritici]|uniref:Uncharacterized protein n=1 Tax=Puccinia striiformis f. sp. tritici TaxID=168172 RepID=A0ACC0E1S8_9BASI|nr:hypothetical protein MJO28_017189 [Puccinia striiformis f. sp. tritici]KAI7943640.1 hypothetical protein MJO28_011168 [Puccinia striiformis f. sp. tritici]KAI7946367.1 hypothetical protein MJO29_010894 [Puccinia striiformis f. sp. tritici]KAI7946430.1 hypothetical protein MJO29_010957 [Puccinia striiformis f. sp. tritici]
MDDINWRSSALAGSTHLEGLTHRLKRRNRVPRVTPPVVLVEAHALEICGSKLRNKETRYKFGIYAAGHSLSNAKRFVGETHDDTTDVITVKCDKQWSSIVES